MRITSMSVVEDRRRLQARVGVLRACRGHPVRPPAGRLLVPPDFPARQVPRDGGEQPPAHAAAAGAARGDLRPPRRGAGREPRLLQHLDHARALAATSTGRCACWPRWPAATSESARTSSGTGGSRPTGRSSWSRTRRWRRWPRSPPGGSTSSCPTWSCSRCRPAAIPPRRSARTCSATSARPASSRWATTAWRRARSSASRASSAPTTSMLMGEDGARRVVVNSVGREIRDPRRGQAGGGPAHPAGPRRRDAAGGRGGVPPLRLLGLGGGAGADHRRRAHAGQPAGLRSQRVRLGHRPRHLAGAQHRRAAAAAEPGHPGPLFAGIDLQDRRRHRRARRGRDDARPPGVLPGRRQLLRPLLQVPPGRRARLGGHAPRASRSRATSTSTPLGNLLGVDRIHEWAERLGLVAEAGIDLPNEVESIIPSTQWKKQRYGEKWYAGETISVAIGQGQVSVTPMSMAVMMASVATAARASCRAWSAPPPTARAGGSRCRRRQSVRGDAAEAGDGVGDARRPVDGGQRRRHRRRAPGSPDATSPARPAPRR